jgi:hypothetical protein
MIKATINTKGVERMMRTATKQVRYAAALALSEAAEDYQKVATVLMRQTLDRPIPFTQRGLKHTRATASRLTASVFMLPRQASYMVYQVEGGTTSGDKPYPFKTADDVYGNLPKGATKRAKAFTVTSRGDGEKLTFVRSRSAKMPKRGWKGTYVDKRFRRWKGLRLIARSTSARHYKPLYPFYERAHSRIPVIVRRVFLKHLQSALGGARW